MEQRIFRYAKQYSGSRILQSAAFTEKFYTSGNTETGRQRLSRRKTGKQLSQRLRCPQKPFPITGYGLQRISPGSFITFHPDTAGNGSLSAPQSDKRRHDDRGRFLPAAKIQTDAQYPREPLSVCRHVHGTGQANLQPFE